MFELIFTNNYCFLLGLSLCTKKRIVFFFYLERHKGDRLEPNKKQKLLVEMSLNTSYRLAGVQNNILC